MSGTDQNDTKESYVSERKTRDSVSSSAEEDELFHKTRELVELKPEQLFLLEVLVNTVEVHKDVSQSRIERKDQDLQPISVRVNFLNFPTIDISQDDFLNVDTDATKDVDDKIISDSSVQPTTTESSNEPTTPTRATKSDKSLTSKESTRTDRNLKYDRSSKNTGKSDAGKIKTSPSKPSISFSSGKSCLFPMAAEDFLKQIQRHPIALNVYRKSPSKEDVLIGQTKIKLGQEFEDAILKSVYDIKIPLPAIATVESDCRLRHPNTGDQTGRISVFIRLSCFGGSIITGFRSSDDGNGYIFKTSKKDEVVEAQKKKGSFLFHKSPYKKENVVKPIDAHCMCPIGQQNLKNKKESMVPNNNRYMNNQNANLGDSRDAINGNRFLNARDMSGCYSLPRNMNFANNIPLNKGLQKNSNENRCCQETLNPNPSDTVGPWRQYLKGCCMKSPDTSKNPPGYCGCAQQNNLPHYIDQTRMCDVPPCPLPNCDCYSASTAKEEDGTPSGCNKFGNVSEKHNVPLQLCWNQNLDANRYDGGSSGCTGCSMSQSNTRRMSTNITNPQNCNGNGCPCSEFNDNQTKTNRNLKENCFFANSQKTDKYKPQQEQNFGRLDSLKGNTGYNNQIYSNYYEGKGGAGAVDVGVATGGGELGGGSARPTSDMIGNQLSQYKNRNLQDMAKGGFENRTGAVPLNQLVNVMPNQNEESSKPGIEEDKNNPRTPEKGGGGDTIWSEPATDQKISSYEKSDDYPNQYQSEDKKTEDLREGYKEHQPNQLTQPLAREEKTEGGRKSGSLKQQQKKKRKFRSVFHYSSGVYPGINIGHRHCGKEVGPVPKTMGWQWNVEDLGDNLKPRRGWRPGSINRVITKMIRQVKVAAGLLTKAESKEKKVVKEVKRAKRPFTPRSGGLSNEISEEYNALPQHPTLHVHKKDGAYYIAMNPLKPDSEDEEEERSPLMFKILAPEDEGSSSSESSIEIEFTAPGAFRRKQKSVRY